MSNFRFKCFVLTSNWFESDVRGLLGKPAMLALPTIINAVSVQYIEMTFI